MRSTRPGSSLAFAMALLSACAGSGDGGNQAGRGGSGGGGSIDIHDPAVGGGSPGSGGATGTGGSSATDGSGGSAGSPKGGAGSSGSNVKGGEIDSSGSGGSNANGGSAGSPKGGAGLSGSSANGGDIGFGGQSIVGGSVASGGSKTALGGTATGGTGPSSGGHGGSGSTVTGSGGSTHTGKWRIMLLGDSITETTCYPKLLSQNLISKGRTSFELVGTSLNNQSCGTAPNVQTEGHGCYLVTNLVKDVPTVVGCGGTKGSFAELKSWAAEKPEVVLMQYGTNDAWSSIATQSILDAYTFVIDQFRAQNPSVIFFVAQITPLNPGGCSNCEANVEALNAKIPAWASGKGTVASPIYVVNVWSSLPAATYTPNSSYTNDGCHPNAAGSQLMADKWYEGITAQGIP